MNYAIETDKGIVREVNEDAAGAVQSNGRTLLVLSDGLGGHRAGEVASQMVVTEVIGWFTENGSGLTAEEAIRKSADYANQKVYEMSRTDAALQGMGATVVMALWDGEHVSIGHAGDSRAYIFGTDGLVPLTLDHCVQNEFSREGRQLNQSLRHMVTRAMGTEPTIELDIQTVHPDERDLLLLCSDGLTNELTTEQIETILQTSAPLSAKAKQLVEEANRHGGKDNITVVLASLEGEKA